jgi:TusA-related sulfurtransferase
MSTFTRGLKVDQSFDARAVAHPESYHQSVARLSAMAENEVLELYIDEGESLRTIPFGLRAEGHEILVSEPAANGVRLLIRKRSLAPPGA